MRPDRRRFCAGLGAAILVPSAVGAREQVDPFAWRPVEVKAEPFRSFSIAEPNRRDFGRVEFLGGLELSGDLREFGGLSSAVIDADGRGLIAASDQGFWVTGRIEADSREQLTGFSSVRLAPMQAPNGRRMRDTRFFDTEGMTRLGNRLYVSVERVHQILRFELGPNGPRGRGVLTAVPAEFSQLTPNQGIEALGAAPAGSRHFGALIAIAEHAPRGADPGAIPGWIIGGPMPGRFAVERTGDFDVTDLGFLPESHDLVLLERRFSPFWGVAFRLRRVPAAALQPGALLRGETLIEANMAYQVDNMEALAIHRGAGDGRVIFTLLSDNNFSVLQRNLVLRFALQT